jgi:hypothetical protein
MREIRSSGLEGGVEFKPPSLPLFYGNDDRPIIPLVFGTRAIITVLRMKPSPRACRKQKE